MRGGCRPYRDRVTIVPETKSWTWVLDRACPECGFDARALDRAELGRLLRENASAWPAVLARADVRERPRPETWSTLEYACHVRDAFAVFGERLHLMTVTDDPLFVNWDQDAAAVAGGYREQDPATVAREVLEEVGPLAEGFEAVTDWTRPGRRSDGAAFTVDSLGRYLLHDPVHHLWDVQG